MHNFSGKLELGPFNPHNQADTPWLRDDLLSGSSVIPQGELFPCTHSLHLSPRKMKIIFQWNQVVLVSPPVLRQRLAS